MKQLPLETINIRYPPQNWLHLYADGSLISREQGASAGVTCCLFSLYRSLGYGTTSFDGEISAVSESLRNLLCHINKFKNAVILSDSKAAILSIVSKHTPSFQTAEITKMLSQLISLNKRIVFQWIPSHCGILGNENADALAKKGSTASYRPVTKSTYYSVKRFIKSTYLDFNKQNLITQSQGKKWNALHHNPQLIPDFPRKSSLAAFRLTTGHDCLAKHLHRIGIYHPLTTHCAIQTSNQEMDLDYIYIHGYYNMNKYSHVSGCLFHLGQVMWRKLQSIRIVEKYMQEINKEAFYQLRNISSNRLDPVFDHIEINYIRGINLIQNTNTSLHFTSIKRLIKNKCKIKQNQALCTKAKDKKWSILIKKKKTEIIPEIPRKSAVAKFRLLTEHDYLAKHLNKIGIYTNPNCPLCNKEEEMTEDHLITCEVLPDGSTTEKYWRARTLMEAKARH
ncbi:hypothetical protein ANN_10917 [Periplaneta americana]|uniref:RNase H type-1 domain-containing protein n=1 Tax=Periplaneta americana TaxID=6978 RepID=A0ABQ8T5C0_PERAM|nr:hypothetical protein ANN_10917 [Periplaneta americana]